MKFYLFLYQLGLFFPWHFLGKILFDFLNILNWYTIFTLYNTITDKHYTRMYAH